MQKGFERTEKRVRAAAWALIAGGGLAVLAALLPEAHLSRVFLTIDPDRTVRPLFAGDAVLLRAGLFLFATTLGLTGVALRRWSGSIARRWGGSSSADRVTPVSRPEPWVYVLLGALLLLGAGLRGVHLVLPLEGDESQTYIFYASRSLLDVVSDYTTPNNHPLHSIFVWFSTQLFGPHPFAIRAPAFLAGLAAIPIGFVLGRRERGDVFGLALAALIAVAPPFVEFSGRGRGYTLQLVVLLWALLALRRAMDRDEPTAWIELAFASALGFWISPSFVLPLGGVALWAVWVRHDPRYLGRLTGAFASGAALTLVFYSPIFVRSGVRSLASPSAWEPQSLESVGRMGVREGTMLAECWAGGLGVGAWPLLGLLGAGVLWGLRRGDPWAKLVVCCVVWYVVFVLMRGLKPRARMLNWALPLLFLGAAGWAGWLQAGSARARRLAGVTILACAGLWGCAQVLAHSDHRTRFVRGHDKENFCTGGYFAASEPVARAFAEVYEPESLLVTPPFAGIVNPIRVELMRLGISPASTYSFSPARGPGHIAGFSTWYLVVPRQRWDGSVRAPSFDELTDGDLLDRVAAVLQTERAELARVSADATLWRELENAVLIRIVVDSDVHAGAARLPEREIVSYGW